MANFEGIIRPFQSVDVTYPRRIVKADAIPDANVVLKIGDGGGTKTLGYSRSYSLTTYMEKQQKEVTEPPAETTTPADTPPAP